MTKEVDNQKEVEKHLSTTAKQSGIVFVGEIAGYFFGFVVSFILAKFFNPKVVGQYSLVRTVVSLTIILTIFGLDKGLLKYISRYRSTGETDKLRQVIKLSFIYGTLFSIIGAVLIFFTREIIAVNIFNDNSLVNSLVYGAWLVIPLTLLRLFGGVYRGFKQLDYFMIAKNFIRKCFFVISVIIISFLSYKETSLVIIMLFVSQLIALIYLTIKTKNLNINFFEILFKFNKNLKRVKHELLAYSSTLIFIAFMGIILNRIDRVMLGIYMTSDVVGVYTIAAKVARLAGFVLMSSNMVFSSIISELYSTNKLKMLEDLYSTITKWIIVTTLPVVISMLFFPEPIMGFFGSEYIVGKVSLVILAAGQLIAALPGANGYILNLSGNEGKVLINNSLMAVINIVMNILLIPKYGMMGAALATAISISAINIVKIFQVKFILDIFPYKKDFLHLPINLGILIIVSLLIKIYCNNIIGVILATVIGMAFSISISYYFKNELDEIVFNKVEKQIKNKFYN